MANEIVPGKETVVRRKGADWSFHLPDQHKIEVDQEHSKVHLSTPLEGTTYDLAGIEETDEEVIVRLGATQGSHGPPSVGPVVNAPTGYPLPEIHEEIERLKARWKHADLPLQEVGGYPPGSTHEDQLRRLRRKLREVGG